MVIGKFDLIYNLDQKTTFLVYLESSKYEKNEKIYNKKIASKYIKILNRQKYILIA
jgi:hypothetical protein